MKRLLLAGALALALAGCVDDGYYDDYYDTSYGGTTVYSNPTYVVVPDRPGPPPPRGYHRPPPPRHNHMAPPPPPPGRTRIKNVTGKTPDIC